MEVGCARCTTYKIIEINETKQTKHIKTQFDTSALAKKWSCSVVLNGASQFLVVNFAKTVSGARRRWWLEAIPAISMSWTLPLPSSSAGSERQQQGCFFHDLTMMTSVASVQLVPLLWEQTESGMD
jgi:hypothetical protein